MELKGKVTNSLKFLDNYCRIAFQNYCVKLPNHKLAQEAVRQGGGWIRLCEGKVGKWITAHPSPSFARNELMYDAHITRLHGTVLPGDLRECKTQQ